MAVTPNYGDRSRINLGLLRTSGRSAKSASGASPTPTKPNAPASPTGAQTRSLVTENPNFNPDLNIGQDLWDSQRQQFIESGQNAPDDIWYVGNKAYRTEGHVTGRRRVRVPMYDRQSTKKEDGPSAFDNFIEKLLKEREEANQMTEQDRQRALADLDELEAQIGQDFTQQVNLMKSEEAASNTQALSNFSQQFAQLGRPVDPNTTIQLSRRLSAGSFDRIARQTALLRDANFQNRFAIARQRDDIFRATNRGTISDMDLLTILQQYGGSQAFSRRYS